MPDIQRTNERLQSRFADDPEMSGLVELFIGELPLRMRALTKALDTHELAVVQRMAHQLRGCSTGYGFPTIGAAAAKVEATLLADSDPADKMQQLTSAVRELVELCRRASHGEGKRTKQ